MNRPSAAPRRRGFTLVELIVVIVVLAILALIAVPSFLSTVKSSISARDAESLGAFGRDALSIARSQGSSDLPSNGDYTTAAGEMPANPTAWTVTFSTDASPQPSSAEFDVSIDDADSTAIAGLAMVTSDGGCVMGIVYSSWVRTWNGANASSCDGSVALLGPGASSGGSGDSGGGSGGSGGSGSSDVAVATGLPTTDSYALDLACAAPGDCTVLGDYIDSGTTDYFVNTESNGTWGTAQEILASLVANGTPSGANLVCPDATDCLVVGDFFPSAGGTESFALAETAGTWGSPTLFPTFVASASSTEVTFACASVGNCIVPGLDESTGGEYPGAVLEEVDGSWGSAQDITPSTPPSGYFSNNAPDTPTAVTCPDASLSDCVVVGSENFFEPGTGSVDGAMVATDVSGTWTVTAEPFSETIPLGQAGEASLDSVSCAAGACSALGTAMAPGDSQQVEVASDVSGLWIAEQAPGLTNQLTAGSTQGTYGNLACAGSTPGDCVVAGDYFATSSTTSPFVLVESAGTWHSAETPSAVDGLPASAEGLNSVACAGTTCAAVGGVADSANSAAYDIVVPVTGGSLGATEDVTPSDNVAYATLYAVACPAAGKCEAAGSDVVNGYQADVLTEGSSNWS